MKSIDRRIRKYLITAAIIVVAFLLPLTTFNQIALAQPDVVIDVVESITVTDSPEVLPPVSISVSESITVTDSPEVLPPVSISVSESITVNDSPEVLPPVSINVAETIVVNDSPQMSVPPEVTTNPATYIYTTSAQLNANLDIMGTDDTVAVSFQWATEAYYSTHPADPYENETDPPWLMVSNGHFQASLAGLSPDTTYHFRAKAVGDGTAYGEDLTFTTESVTSDGDVDGVPDAVENNAPNNGDGNYDGVPDAQQENVTSLPNAHNGGYVTITSPAGTSFVNVSAIHENSVPPQGKPNIAFPYGFFSFEINGLSAPGETVELTMHVPGPVTQYWKYGPTPGDHNPHWYQIYMESVGNVITFELTDGGLGDDWWVADSMIIDQGGPGNPPVPAPAGGTGVPIFPSLYVGITAALAAGILAYVIRKRLLGQDIPY
jgi:hypothetical protein